MVFVIDLTPKDGINDCFNCWIDQISSLIMFAFNLVQDVTSFTYSLHIAIVTFDGITVNTYYTLNDPPINYYPELTQILSLIQSLVPVLDEYQDSLLGSFSESKSVFVSIFNFEILIKSGMFLFKIHNLNTTTFLR